MNTVSLSEFIREKGDAVVAEALGVTARTTADWRRGQRRPHPKYIKALLAIGGGALTLDSLYCGRSVGHPAGDGSDGS
jgi:transcriptional regulator with XRE-family HTH domain